MGMAAGQARLLSITSRMSDNELRAQIINNNKMRLATESSQVSEAYVNALNQAQMMFTNYDADNNASYQQLTFNSLTSYNPYNNQYGLVNASGQLLVSETDAKNFMNADGDMDKFLASYGLEQTTTYFDELTKAAETKIVGEDGETSLWTPNGNVPVMSTDDSGNVIYVDSGYTPEQLEIMFNGGTDDNGVKHSGYDTALHSSIYNNYISYAEKFDSAFTDYAESIVTNMSNVLHGFKGNNNNNLNDIKTQLEQIKSTDSNFDENGNLKSPATLEPYLDDLSTIVSLASDKEYAGENNAYFTDLQNEVNAIKDGTSISQLTNQDISWDSTTNELSFEDIVLRKNSTGSYDVYILSSDDTEGTEGTEDTEDTEAEEADEYTSLGVSIPDGTTKLYIVTDSSGNISAQTTAPSAGDYVCYEFNTTISSMCQEEVPDTASITCTSKLTDIDKIEAAIDIIDELDTAIFNNWDTNKQAFIMVDGKESAAHLAYRQAAAEFLVMLYNEAKGENGTKLSVADMNESQPADELGYVKLTDGTKTYYVDMNDITNLATNPDMLSTYITSGIPAIEATGTSPDINQGTGTTLTLSKEVMQDLLDVITLNNVMNTYGEPKITWIDKNNPNENGEAKYAWYSNLFTRMQKGYAVLQDGLASSNEWIQFALENGIVTMEQVDSEDNWNGLNYTNCSDITEQTNDKAVALAEAEYNAAMNKIENKDKRYDLELKNIDTEHNSLQTEYDSIKTAIDKNIERTFKIYS